MVHKNNKHRVNNKSHMHTIIINHTHDAVIQSSNQSIYTSKDLKKVTLKRTLFQVITGI